MWKIIYKYAHGYVCAGVYKTEKQSQREKHAVFQTETSPEDNTKISM